MNQKQKSNLEILINLNWLFEKVKEMDEFLMRLIKERRRYK